MFGIGTTYSDDEARELAKCVKNIRVRAITGHAVVWFLPYRRNGLIELPEQHAPESVEAVVLDDATGHNMPRGTVAVVSRHDGTYFEHQGQRLCRVPRQAFYLVS